jgi:hypothetical protein
MDKTIFEYKNKSNKKVNIVMDPSNLSHMEFVSKKQTLYKVYDTEDEFNSELGRITKLANS